MSKKNTLLILPLLVFSYSLGSSFSSIPQRIKRDPLGYFGAFACGAVTASTIFGVIHWFQTQESEAQICIKAQEMALEAQSKNNLFFQLHTILKDYTLSVEQQLEQMYDLFEAKRITNYLEQVESTQNQFLSVRKKLQGYKLEHQRSKGETTILDTLIYDNHKIFDYLAELSSFLRKHQSFFAAKNELASIDVMLGQSTISSTLILNKIERFKKHAIQLHRYPHTLANVDRAIAQLNVLHQTVIKREQEVRMRKMSALLDEKFKIFGELNHPYSLSFIEERINAYQLSHNTRYPYVAYVRDLQEAIEQGSVILSELRANGFSYDYRFEAQLSALQALHDYIKANDLFMKHYREDLASQQRDTLEMRELEELRKRADKERAHAKEMEDRICAEQERAKQLQQEVEAARERACADQRAASEAYKKQKALEEAAQAEKASAEQRIAELQKQIADAQRAHEASQAAVSKENDAAQSDLRIAQVASEQ